VTFDVVALCRENPGPEVMLGAMHAAGPQLRVNTVDESQLIQLYHEDGRLMLTTEGARLVQVEGEVRRLLGIDEGVPSPVWWVETRAPSGDPEAAETARRFTRALVAQAGGVSWSTR
jgi:hypothetical protein